MELQYVAAALFLLIGLVIFLLIHQRANRQALNDAPMNEFFEAERKARNAKFEAMQRIAQAKAGQAFTNHPQRVTGDIIQGEWE